MKLKSVAIVVLAVIAFSILSGCGNKDEVALLNGESISRKGYNQELDRMKKTLEASGSKIDQKMMDQLEKQVLEQMILRKIEMQEAKKRNLLVSQEEIDTKLKDIIKSYGDDSKFRQYLKSQNTNEGKYREELQYQLSREALFDELTKDVKVNENEIKEYYDKNPQEATKKKERINDVSVKLLQEKKAMVYNSFLLKARKNVEIKSYLKENN